MPRSADPAHLKPVQGRVPGSLFDGQRLEIAVSMQSAMYRVSMLFAGKVQVIQNQQLQRALQEIRRLVCSHNHLRVQSLP